MKKHFLFLVVLVLISALTSASFSLNNLSVITSYGPGETIRGWVNISLQDEVSTSVLSAFDSQISIIDFLENNSLSSGTDFSCFPADCKTNYKESNKELNKTYTLSAGDRKSLGLKIVGEISSIDSFSLNIQSTAQESRYPQLVVDILDDNEIEWQAHNFSGNYGDAIYNCYNREQATQIAEITQTEYCQKIEIPPASRIKAGAEIVAIPGKSGSVKFRIRMYNEESGDFGTCTASATSTGNISCEIKNIVEKKQNFFVCISTERYEDDNKYGMYYEQNAPCGFSDNEEGYNYDFPIFVYQGRYAPMGRVLLNQNEVDNYRGAGMINLAEEIGDYIEERYENNCNSGCIIPIKIIAGEQQTLNISDGQLGYTAGISTTERYFYDISEEPSKVNMGFKILNLEKSDIKVPNTYGQKTMSLKLGGVEITSRDIAVLKLATIDMVYPLEASAVIPVKFYVYATGNITEYKWNFGDGTADITTKENFTSHTYSTTGSYKLRISAINPQGEATRDFDILVKSPKDEINKTLVEKRESLNTITAEINAIAGWYRPEIEKEINVSNLKAELDAIQKRYETSNDYVEIMTALLKINIPSGLESVNFKGDFLPLPENIDPSYLTDDETDSGEYSDTIVLWMAENLDLEVETNIIYLKDQGVNEPLFTAVTLYITPQGDFEEAFLVIEGGGIKFKEDYNQEELDGAAKIDLSGIEEQKIISFILPGKVEAIDLPVYVSPRISNLPNNSGPGPCDNDGKCEKDSEENKKNCPNDCHGINWPRILVFVIFIFCVFVVYIILQEWYKRYYEEHLFKDKNDLYNLMSFIFNALRQGKDKGEAYKTLKQYGWKNEQIVYVYRKLLGKRTGMWEIPLFRAFEKKKVKEELAKRGQMYSPKNGAVNLKSSFSS